MGDWGKSDAYAYTTSLNRDQWAWEFLRRNPEYQSDYAAFMSTWRALEAEYGIPPNRDFAGWKSDPRAYHVESGPDDVGDCLVDENKVLIECWMGAKWGFHKFPLDPAMAAPTPEQLSWRQVHVGARTVTADHRDYLGESATRVALGFDLKLPLPAQMEAAKFHLVSLQTRLRKEGMPVPETVASRRADWTKYLRLLDAAASGTPPEEIAIRLESQDVAADLEAARDLRDGGYRRILLLPDR
jgi:Family of unknown function (DUF6499)